MIAYSRSICIFNMVYYGRATVCIRICVLAIIFVCCGLLGRSCSFFSSLPRSNSDLSEQFGPWNVRRRISHRTFPWPPYMCTMLVFTNTGARRSIKIHSCKIAISHLDFYICIFLFRYFDVDVSLLISSCPHERLCARDVCASQQSYWIWDFFFLTRVSLVVSPHLCLPSRFPVLVFRVRCCSMLFRLFFCRVRRMATWIMDVWMLDAVPWCGVCSASERVWV